MDTTKPKKPKAPWLALFTSGTSTTPGTAETGAGTEPAHAGIAAPPASGLSPVTLIAALVTAASVAFTTWSVYDLLAAHAPALVALATGVGLEMVWLFALASEYQQAKSTGRTEQRVSVTGWVLAVLTAVVIVVHAFLTAGSLVILAAMPLAAKAGWHLRTRAVAAETRARLEAEQAAREEAQRAEREAARAEQAEREEARRREQALSTNLTEDEEQDIADLYRRANLARRRAKAQTELTTAEAEADQHRAEADAEAERIRQETEHRMRQEALQRQVDEQMAVQRANADLLKQRAELEAELRLAQPYQLGAGQSRVPDDASSLEPAPGAPGEATFAGFGSALKAVAGTSTSTGGEQQAPGVPGVPGQPGTHHSAAEAEANRRQVAQAHAALLKAQGGEPKIAEVARAAGISHRAAGRHLRALGLRG